MKLLISIFILLFSNFTWAQEVCVNFKIAGWSQNKFKALPDGSILITNPHYVFNGETYYVGADYNSTQGICRVFGRKSTIRRVPGDLKDGLSSIILNESGEIIDTGAWESIITSVQCK